MINKKKVIIASAIAMTLVASVVGITTSKADSNKTRDKKPNVSIEFKDDNLLNENSKVDLNTQAQEHGSVILPDGSSSKDVVLKDDSNAKPGQGNNGNVTNGNKPSNNKDFDADSDDDLANGIVTPNSDAADHGSVILPDGSSSKDIVVRDDVCTYPSYNGNYNGNSTDFDADSDDDIANGIVTPNADASDYGSVILPGGASSRDYVRR